MQICYNGIVHPSPTKQHIWMWDVESTGFTVGRLAPSQRSEAKGISHLLRVNHIAKSLSGAGPFTGDNCLQVSTYNAGSAKLRIISSKLRIIRVSSTFQLGLLVGRGALKLPLTL